MSSPERNNSLADALGIDADELRRVEESSAPRNPGPTGSPRVEPDEPIEVSPGIVRLGGHEYVKLDDGRLEPAGNPTQMNFSVSAKEKHLLKQLAYNERRSLVSYLREILENRGLL